jgi:hypothetical protein
LSHQEPPASPTVGIEQVAPESDDNREPPILRSEEAGRAAWLTLAVVAVGLFLAVVSTPLVSVALPTIGRDLHASATDLQWIVEGPGTSSRVEQSGWRSGDGKIRARWRGQGRLRPSHRRLTSLVS